MDVHSRLLAPIVAACGAASILAAQFPAEGPAPAPPDIDLAICLDTSGSMDGLLESAKQRIWAIVNDLALARPLPHLRVALLTYGNDGHDPQRGWVVVDVPLTEDLDEISRQLFALTTNGGTELVGRVLKTATDQLAWSDSPAALKLIVVAGNETADQDQEVPYRAAASAAIARGVLVNAIYCGSPADELAPGWHEIARLADGQFATIDQAEGTVTIETPFDARLVELSAAVNRTYIPIGRAGGLGAANQVAQDRNASALNSEAAAARAIAKNGSLYFCAWDLLDGLKSRQMRLEDVPERDLPMNMQVMRPGERAAYVRRMQDQRERIRRQIEELTVQRQGFLDAERSKLGPAEDRALDRALRRAIRAQAEARGFRFAAPTASGT
ncbi:MAG: vWA domain-containing protein [Planctomycetota bacterium]